MVTSASASSELVLRGYRAFVDGDFDTISSLLAPEIEWYPAGGEGAYANHSDAVEAIRDAYSEGHRVELERCISRGDDVVVSFRAAREARDPNDPRPLQSRRTFTIARYAAVITIEDGLVARVREYPHLTAALEAAGIDPDEA